MPVLGICYGQMAMAEQLGGTVESGHHREFGRALVDVRHSALFDGIWNPGEHHTVWMSHGDRITALPPGFSVKGTSENAPFALIEDEKRSFYGLMFHPEVVHTPGGAKLSRISCTRSPGSPATGRWRSSRTRRSPASASRSGGAG